MTSKTRGPIKILEVMSHPLALILLAFFLFGVENQQTTQRRTQGVRAQRAHIKRNLQGRSHRAASSGSLVARTGPLAAAVVRAVLFARAYSVHVVAYLLKASSPLMLLSSSSYSGPN